MYSAGETQNVLPELPQGGAFLQRMHDVGIIFATLTGQVQIALFSTKEMEFYMPCESREAEKTAALHIVIILK